MAFSTRLSLKLLWNNNNAEHAVIPFAKYRKIRDTNFSEKSIKEYLILLSIQQTCKYRGVSFLEFLKSGKKKDLEYENSKRCQWVTRLFISSYALF